ncbi:hypothetical protein [Desulfovermiculus halophilus]|jgi:hypothetical protein|uniref:hypothetical protein n=1 Tax=Desulfovermiculus halophilus TaxID=339722 RepID=UPI000485F69A|nr:hypothetical protein [Desulfovermiculus halophilus]
MSKREKIFIALTIAVAVGALLFLYLDRAPRDPSGPRTGAQSASSAQDAAARVQKVQDPPEVNPEEYTLSSRDQRIILAASQPWPKEIFVPQKQARPQPSGDTPDPGLRYSGYMQTNGRCLAIINGRPYASGDRLHGTGWDQYHVRDITPHKVVLTTSQGKRKTLALQTQRGLTFHSPPTVAGKEEQ